MIPSPVPPRRFLLARKAFGDARRDRTLYVTTVLFAVLGVGLGYAYGTNAGDAAPPVVAVAAPVLAALVPIAGVTTAYDVVPAQRRSGSLRLLLTLPHSRAAVIVGSVLGRGAVLSVAATAYLAGAAGVAALYGHAAPAGPLTAAVAATVLLSVAVAALVTLPGALTASGPTALGGAGALVFLAVFWNGLLAAAWSNQFGSVPGWIEAVQRVDLLAGYVDAALLAHDGDPAGLLVLGGVAITALAAGVAGFERAHL